MSFLMTLLKQQLGKALELLLKERARREGRSVSDSQDLPPEAAALRAELQDSDRSSTPRLAHMPRAAPPGGLDSVRGTGAEALDCGQLQRCGSHGRPGRVCSMQGGS